MSEGSDTSTGTRVLAVDHLYLTVTDLESSQRFYDPLMEYLGFKKGVRPIGGDPHVHYFNPVTQISLRPARGDGASSRHDPYAPGLHHLCLQLADRAAIDAAARYLATLGIDVSEPAEYAEYAPDYYAVFFEDPDGLRLELVARTGYRELIATRWHELEGFVNPVARLREKDRQRQT